MKRIVGCLMTVTLTAAASTGFGGSAAASSAVLPPSPEVNAAVAELEDLWRELPTDAFGNREALGWTIAPDGTQMRTQAAASDCATGRTCLFQHPGFTGWIRTFGLAGSANLVSPYDNAMSSWINRNSLWAAWYPDAYSGGTQHCMPSGVQVSAVTASEDATASSVTIFPSGATC